MSLDKRVVIGLMIWCGWRVGEAVHLSVDDIEHTASGIVVRVPTEVASADGWSAKTATGSRSVPVIESFTDHDAGEDVDVPLDDWLRAMELRGEGVGFSSKKTATRALVELLEHVGSEPFRRPEVTRVFNGKGVELTFTTADVINHDLRASWCAQALRSDINRFTVRDWGGWSDLSMVNRYAKYVGDPSGASVEAF